MIAAVHQPHYFPWLGFLDKIAKSNCFILGDEMQLADRSNMFRNRFLAQSGKEKYLGISFEKAHSHYLEIPYNAVKINHAIPWQAEHVSFLKGTYQKALFFREIWPFISSIYKNEYETVCHVCRETIAMETELFDISTPIVMQSELDYARGMSKNALNIALCKAVNADVYLSGNGARKYNDEAMYRQNNIKLIYQQFSYPQYPQINTQEFVPNLSALDLLFNCGIKKSREIFWKNVKAAHELETEMGEFGGAHSSF